MTRFTFVLQALLVTATFAATVPDHLLNNPIHSPYPKPSLVTANSIPDPKATQESNFSSVGSPVATPEISLLPTDPFATPQPCREPLDSLMTAEPNLVANDPFVTSEPSNGSSSMPMDRVTTAEPSFAPFDPTAEPRSIENAEPSSAPEPSFTPIEPTDSAEPVLRHPSQTLVPAPSASVDASPEPFHSNHLPHKRPAKRSNVTQSRRLHSTHHAAKCYVQNVNFACGTAERCCEERFACGSPECAHAQACRNPDMCFCRKDMCRKVFIKFSYFEKVDQACSKHIVNHF